MRYTFKPDDCMVITIPLTSVRNAAEGQLMPDKFSCRFKDNYKVYQRGWPKALGVAQIATAVFVLCLGGIKISFDHYYTLTYIFMISSILFIVSGSLAVAAAHTPSMPLMKVSFVFNIISLAIIQTVFACLAINVEYYGFSGSPQSGILNGLRWMMLVLFLLEFLLSVILIHWESKALCRTHFNSLPMITLKQDM
ncbi:membrane-spanning 4-domains subfamily A member 4A isoform X1 [Tachysurus vachellii]|uniref:membrane-spanning 4-domains subfamily A member 4A isoform X1 n=1 Tax=Tachysurus vachellii TaxID=175792 RepID=UPI00296AAD9E|nr:membrane-spanning 4-domains subfamily A member 4A isoform X1 [Tachysurus vachellii]XP_060717175.1 membrane-spanning 4-domains subfamily A member 4A isoform X1 [Tachysurus vachellii]